MFKYILFFHCRNVQNNMSVSVCMYGFIYTAHSHIHIYLNENIYIYYIQTFSINTCFLFSSSPFFFSTCNMSQISYLTMCWFLFLCVIHFLWVHISVLRLKCVFFRSTLCRWGDAIFNLWHSLLSFLDGSVLLRKKKNNKMDEIEYLIIFLFAICVPQLYVLYLFDHVQPTSLKSF